MKKRTPILAAMTVTVMLSSTGCATYSTIANADRQTAKILSGARLDARGVAGETETNHQFNVSPPRYPLLDLPFSFTADVLILGVTFPVALYEMIFE